MKKSKILDLGKYLLALALFFCVVVNSQEAFARAQYFRRVLTDSSGTALSDYSLTSGVAVFSETLEISDNEGFCSILVTEDKAGGAGDVDISAQYSVDGTNWYTAYTSDMAGTITAEGNIVTALGNVTRWIVYTPRLAKYARFKLDPDANSQVTLSFIYLR